MEKEITAAWISVIPASILTVAALLLGWNQNRLAEKKAQRETHREFNERFDKLNDRLNKVLANPSILGEDLSRAIAQDYLNLCSEEYLAYTDGLVSKKVWTAWEIGIFYYLKSDFIRSAFKEERSRSAESYYGFFDGIPIK